MLPSPDAFLGLPLSIGMDIAALCSLIDKGESPRFVTFINPSAWAVAQKDPSYLSNLKQMTHVLPDGHGVAKACEKITGRPCPRVSFDMSSVAGPFFEKLAHEKKTIALVGGVEGVTEKVKEKLCHAYPDLQISRCYHGFDDEALIVRQLVDLAPDVVIVGMGVPKQEEFLVQLRRAAFRGMAITCGGFLDQYLQKTNYYPDFIDRLNLRFAYRFYKEPRRLWRRYLVEYWPFMLASFKAFAFGKKKEAVLSEKERRTIFFMQDFAGGGAERVMVRIANSLHAMGEAIEIVVIRNEGPCREQLNSAIKVTALNTKKTFLSLPALIRYIRKARPHALCTSIPHVCVLATLACRLSGCRVRVVLREANVYPPESRECFPLVEKIAYCLIPYIYPLADAIIAVSDSIRAEMAQRMPRLLNKISVIHNPLDSEALFAAAQAPVDHPWFNKSSLPVILAIGRLHKQKDYPTLIEAFNRVLKKRAARLVVLGIGPEKDNLDRLVSRLGLKEFVDFAGFKSNPMAYMRLCDVYVLSSLWEGCPNTLMEALVCAPAVVATDCAGASGLILDGGKIGALVPPQDPEALATALEQALDKKQTVSALRARAKDFDIQKTTSLYRRVLFGDS